MDSRSLLRISCSAFRGGVPQRQHRLGGGQKPSTTVAAGKKLHVPVSLAAIRLKAERQRSVSLRQLGLHLGIGLGRRHGVGLAFLRQRRRQHRQARFSEYAPYAVLTARAALHGPDHDSKNNGGKKYSGKRCNQVAEPHGNPPGLPSRAQSRFACRAEILPTDRDRNSRRSSRLRWHARELCTDETKLEGCRPFPPAIWGEDFLCQRVPHAP